MTQAGPLQPKDRSPNGGLRRNFVGGDPSHHRIRNLVTPEGVAIQLTMASAGDRILAFMVDAAIIILCMLAVTITCLYAVPGENSDWVVGIFLLIAFLLRNFYFTYFELRWSGATPGKRLRKLRVVDVHGGQLTEDAVIARNLTRDLELFIPLTICFDPQVIWPSAPSWSPFLATLWLIILALLPLFNYNRQRFGDLIAGTLVILTPHMELLGDLAKSESTEPGISEGTAKPEFSFSDEQLSRYGIYELQVLEKILRHPDPYVRWKMMKAVFEKITEKISWQGGSVNERDFLLAFYAALRSHLERKMLLGKRRKDKFDR